MSTIFDEILERLNDGLCYHADVDGILSDSNLKKLEKTKLRGEDIQTIKPTSQIIRPTDEEIRNALREILESGEIQIGETNLDTPDYLAFVAWHGSVDERAERAIKSVRECNDSDRPYAYWLCLRDNVDRYEDIAFNTDNKI